MDNVGFVLGKRGVLVIDVPLSRSLANQIQERVREVTDKPILYFVNSNYHGDHAFGNCASPVETLVVQHHLTADYVPYFEEEKVFLTPCVDSDPKIFEGVSLRLPDIVFDDYLRIDLSDRQVELHYFGPANTLGDTITYVPEAKVAWTGNLTGGIFGLALESDASTFLETLTHFVQTFSIKMLIPAGKAPYTGQNSPQRPHMNRRGHKYKKCIRYQQIERQKSNYLAAALKRPNRLKQLPGMRAQYPPVGKVASLVLRITEL